MTFNINFIVVLAGVISSSLIVAVPTGSYSYLLDIGVSYEGDKWICDGITCPAETYGCRIQRKNNAVARNKLDAVSTCFDKEKTPIISAAKTIELFTDQRIDIDLESYVGAKSVFSCGYGLGGNENAHGTVSPNGWSDFKKSAERNKKTVEDSNSA